MSDTLKKMQTEKVCARTERIMGMEHIQAYRLALLPSHVVMAEPLFGFRFNFRHINWYENIRPSEFGICCSR